MYRCEAATVEAFIQQFAVSYVLNGYFHVVIGRIPDGKNPCAVDATLIQRYEIDISKWTRARLKKQGRAGVQYLRYGNDFVIVATEGEHRFYEREQPSDLREAPFEFYGYRVSCYQRPSAKWHPSIKIAPRRFKELRRWFRRNALRYSPAELEEKLRTLPFAPFAGVARQYVSLLNIVNRQRKRAGLTLLDASCVRRRRKPVRVFEAPR